MAAERTETRKRSMVKALTYRVVIVCLDFLAIYLFTHKIEVALGFMIVSNIYTTVKERPVTRSMTLSWPTVR